MSGLETIPGKTLVQLIREMRPADVLDMATDAYFKYLKLRTEKSCQEYNWWVDVYNFKRGKKILKYAHYQPVKITFERHFGEHHFTL